MVLLTGRNHFRVWLRIVEDWREAERALPDLSALPVSCFLLNLIYWMNAKPGYSQLFVEETGNIPHHAIN